MAALPYLYFAIAIVFEVIRNSALQASESFIRLVPSLITAVTYAASFLFLALTLRDRGRHRLPLRSASA